MMPQVLYRKWRPLRFQNVIGQEPITQTLSHALKQGRVAHAYLFCGPRGTGKTTTARILAKAINCTDIQDGEPCDRCQSCQLIAQGRALDLIEIDAASHRGIDDIRALQERVHYAPSESQYKTYIIDEVHMLTLAAFNALLKTLEEPPPHVILILATTEPQDVPNTIISRCQRFDFRRISSLVMANRLEDLCGWEGIDTNKETLLMIARQAGGSLRDAINLLEQLSISYGSSLKLSHVRDLLGLGEEEHTLRLVEHILRKETSEGLELINQIASEGVDLKQLQHGVVESLRAALLLKSAAKDVIEQSAEVVDRLTTVIDLVTIQHLLHALQLFGQPTRKGDNVSLLSLELALVQSTLDERNQSKEAPQGTIEDLPKQALQPLTTTSTHTDTPESHSTKALEILPNINTDDVSSKPNLESPTDTSDLLEQQIYIDPTPQPLPMDNQVEAAPPSETLTETVDKHWPEIVQALSKTKGKRFMIGALMRDSRSRRLDGQIVTLSFANKGNMERLREEIESPQGGLAVKEVLSQILGSPLELRVELDESQTRTGNDGNSGHLVRTALRMGAKIVNEENKK